MEVLVAIGAAALSVVACVDELSTMAVTAWNGTLNAPVKTQLSSAVHDVG